MFKNISLQVQQNKIHVQLQPNKFGHGGLGVTYSPRGPRFAGSNPAEVDGFFEDVKTSTSPPGGTLSWGSRV